MQAVEQLAPLIQLPKLPSYPYKSSAAIHCAKPSIHVYGYVFMYDEALKEQKQGVTRYRQPNRKPTVRARNTLLLT